MVPERPPVREREVLDIGGACIRRADEEEHAGAVTPARREEGLDRVVAQVRARRHGVREREPSSRGSRNASAYAREVEPMSPRLTSSEHEQPDARARSRRPPRAPGSRPSPAPRRTPTAASPRRRTARPRRRSPCRTGRQTTPQRLDRGPPRPRSSIGRRSSRGSRPTTSWLCFRVTASASRSAKFAACPRLKARRRRGEAGSSNVSRRSLALCVTLACSLGACSAAAMRAAEPGPSLLVFVRDGDLYRMTVDGPRRSGSRRRSVESRSRQSRPIGRESRSRAAVTSSG